jgi:hypothetical protein
MVDGRYEKEKNLLSLPGIKPRRPAGSLVAITTELHRLQQLQILEQVIVGMIR